MKYILLRTTRATGAWRTLLFALWGLALTAGCTGPAKEEAAAEEGTGQPNIIFILADDLGWRDAGYQGSSFYETPNIDALARQGMTFTSAYAAAPICSPTRASILTGCYPARLHQTDYIPGRPDMPDQRLLQVEDLNHLPLAEETIAERLRAAGYATAHIGKWHLGSEGYFPADQGFDFNLGASDRGMPPSYFHPYERGSYRLADLNATGRPGEQLTDRLGREAVNFIAEHRDRPFFLYLSFYAVHTPLQAKPELVDKYRAKADRSSDADPMPVVTENGRRVRQVQNHPVYAGMVESLDENVGRVLDALDRHGLADHTLVIFFSDNGGLSMRDGGPTSNLPLRAGKGYLYEGGIRVPMIIRWPGVTEPGSSTDVPVSSIDFFPTIREITGLRPAEGRAVDGVSLVPLLRQEGDAGRDALYWHYPHYHNQGSRPSGAIRRGDYKLIEFFEDGRAELYNLVEDPGEERDLSGEMPERAEALREQLQAWRASVDAQMPPGPNPDYEGS